MWRCHPRAYALILQSQHFVNPANGYTSQSNFNQRSDKSPDHLSQKSIRGDVNHYKGASPSDIDDIHPTNRTLAFRRIAK